MGDNDCVFCDLTQFRSAEVCIEPHHAHLHVIPRFDDEPFADQGGRSAIKVPANRRPHPDRPGNGRARAFGP